MKFPPCLRVPALICLLTAFLVAQDTPSARGFDHFYNLEYDQALAEFQKAAQQELLTVHPIEGVAVGIARHLDADRLLAIFDAPP